MMRPLRPGDRLQAKEHAFGVHPMNAVPIGFRDVHDIGAARHAGVVHEDIDAPVLANRAIDHALDIGDAPGISR